MLFKRLIIALGLATILTSCSGTPAIASSIPRYSTTYSKYVITQVATGGHKGNYRYDYHHYNAYQTKCLLNLARRESGFRNWATNGSCFGLFQLSYGMTKGRTWYYPNWNTDRAIHYIIGKYGTPGNALAHSYRYGWY